MEQVINSLIDSSTWPILTAFLLGLLTSVSPCTFTTNLMVLGFIGKDMSGGRQVFVKGICYTLGRTISYTLLGLVCIRVLKQGASTFTVQSFISSYGGYVLAPTLIIYGLFLLFGNKLPLGRFGFRPSEANKKLQGNVGALVLGLLFALAFCPVSGVFYFGMLLPMAALEPDGYLFSRHLCLWCQHLSSAYCLDCCLRHFRFGAFLQPRKHASKVAEHHCRYSIHYYRYLRVLPLLSADYIINN